MRPLRSAASVVSTPWSSFDARVRTGPTVRVKPAIVCAMWRLLRSSVTRARRLRGTLTSHCTGSAERLELLRRGGDLRLRAERGVGEQPRGGRVVDRGLGRGGGREGGDDERAEQGKNEPALHGHIIGPSRARTEARTGI